MTTYIAGAVWGGAGSDKEGRQHYQNPDGTAKPLKEIEDNWKSRWISPDEKVFFYCGTGWRASEAFLYAYLLGWQEIAVYDGGWYEWSADPNNPFKTGEN